MIPAPPENIMRAENHEQNDEDKHETKSQKVAKPGVLWLKSEIPVPTPFPVSLRLRLRRRLWFQLQGPIRQAEVPAVEMSKFIFKKYQINTRIYNTY